MNSTMRFSVFAFSALLVAGSSGNAAAQQATMSFFVTSAGSGKGADLGGLAGADRICQQLAQAAGAGSHTWHAYLSTQAAEVTDGQRPGPHRQGSVAERQRGGHRQGCRRFARR